jgi:hypothetical protein
MMEWLVVDDDDGGVEGVMEWLVVDDDGGGVDRMMEWLVVDDDVGGVDVADCFTAATPVTFTLKYDAAVGLSLQVYLAVILFSPSLIAVYLGLSVKLHLE